MLFRTGILTAVATLLVAPGMRAATTSNLSIFGGNYEGNLQIRENSSGEQAYGTSTVRFTPRADGLAAVMTWRSTIVYPPDLPGNRKRYGFRRSGRVVVKNILGSALDDGSKTRANYSARKRLITIEKKISRTDFVVRLKIRVLDLGSRRQLKIVERIDSGDTRNLLVTIFSGSSTKSNSN